MTAIDYAQFDTLRLGELLEQSKRREQDFHDRLETWRRKAGEASDANLAPGPDPVAKRLGFLLADSRNQRRAVERELAMRLAEGSNRHSERKPGRGDRRTAEPTVAYGNTSAATPQTMPAVVA